MTDLIVKVQQNTRLLADQPALIGDVTTASTGSLTWGELGTRIDGLVGGFRSRGRQPGERIGIALYHGTFGLELYLAAQAAGLQPVLLGIGLNQHLVTAVETLDLAEVFTGPELLESARAAMGERPVWSCPVGEDVHPLVADPDGDTTWVGLRAPETVSGIQYSTGTTGVPKGMVRSVGADYWDAVNRALCMRTRHSERWLAASPTNINVAVGALRGMALTGGAVIALDDVSLESLDANSRDGVTVLPLQAPAWRRVLDSGLGEKLVERGLRVIVATGQRTPRPTLDRLAALIEGHGEVVNSYGLTETSTLATLTSSMPEFPVSSSVGRPAPLSTVDVVPLPAERGDARGAGEVRVSGPAISPGYVLPNEPGASNTGVADDGWFWTGDAGRWDERGNLQILGRLKDAFVLDGSYVFPFEVETRLGEVPGVLDSVVLGFAPDGTTATVDAPAESLAVVVQLDPAVPEAADGAAKALDGLPAEGTRLLQVATMPRNSSAKINRAQVAELVRSGSPDLTGLS